MKILLPGNPSRRRNPASRHGERGSLVIMLMILLAIMLVYVHANVRTLDTLKAEIKVVEKRQIKRLATIGNATNAVPGQAQSPSTTTSPKP
jgi:hypothetical protein